MPNDTGIEERERLLALIKDFSTAVLVTAAGDGDLHARPMAVAGVDDDATIWFLTSRSSTKVREVDQEHRALVVMQKGDSAFLSLVGDARTVVDRGRIDDLWKRDYAIWFPRGKEDAELVLLAVKPDRGEYWDLRGGSRIAYAFEAARAFVSGERPKVDEPAQHGRTKL